MDGFAVCSTFDANSNQTRIDYANGTVTIMDFDALNHVTANTQRFSSDVLLSRLDYTLGRVTTWGYDAINRPVSRTLPMGQQETYAYDAVGNRTSHTDFNGATHTYTYDADNDWLVSENYADGLTIGYGYNAIGLRTSATDANGGFTYTYDNRDRLINEVKHDGSELVYDYDANGNRTTLTTVVAGVSNTATYTFDALNRMSSVTDADNRTTDYTFDANSNQTRIDHANGTATIMDFDALNRVTAITQRSSSDVLLSRLDYTLDNTGRRTAVTESTGRSSIYTYDGLYRLTRESIVDSQIGNLNRSFVYDAVSNRVEQTLNGNVVTYTYDDNDRLLSAGLDTYSYDDNGNTTSEIVDGVANSYTYDSRNRLVEASTGGVSQVMAYDPDGIRVRKSVAGVTTDYLIDSNRDYAQVLYEKSATSELKYTFGTDLVGLNTGSEHYTYHTDALGSTRALTDSTGNVADEIQYDAWGDVLSGGDVAENQYLYTGEQFDAQLGKTYLRARYYSSGVGRFGQMDEYIGNRFNPRSTHKFQYADLDPILFVDPTGYFSLQSFTTSTNIQSTLATTGSASMQTAMRNALWGELRDFVKDGITEQAFGVVGELIVGKMVQAVSGTTWTGQSAQSFGSTAHKNLEDLIKDNLDEINESIKDYGVDIEAELFLDEDKEKTYKRAKGSLGLDVVVRNSKTGKIVLAFDMKTGKSGTSKSKAKRYKNRFSSAPLIDIHIERKK